MRTGRGGQGNNGKTEDMQEGGEQINTNQCRVCWRYCFNVCLSYPKQNVILICQIFYIVLERMEGMFFQTGQSDCFNLAQLALGSDSAYSPEVDLILVA